MKIRHTSGHDDEKIELQMTPMIDIVFQLLIFFIMTFKIVAQEGDFNITMPAAAPNVGVPDDPRLPPMRLRLRADDAGELVAIQLNDIKLAGFDDLRLRIISLLGDERGPGSIQDTAEIELDFDEALQWQYVIQATTAVTGQLSEDGQVVKLIERIRFAPGKTPSDF